MRSRRQVETGRGAPARPCRWMAAPENGRPVDAESEEAVDADAAEQPTPRDLVTTAASMAGRARRTGHPRPPRGGPGKRGRLQFLAACPSSSQRRQREGRVHWERDVVVGEAVETSSNEVSGYRTARGVGSPARPSRRPETPLVDDLGEAVIIHDMGRARPRRRGVPPQRPTSVSHESIRSTARGSRSATLRDQCTFLLRGGARGASSEGPPLRRPPNPRGC